MLSYPFLSLIGTIKHQNEIYKLDNRKEKVSVRFTFRIKPSAWQNILVKFALMAGAANKNHKISTHRVQKS